MVIVGDILATAQQIYIPYGIGDEKERERDRPLLHRHCAWPGV